MNDSEIWQAYPLDWPEGYRRTRFPKRGNFHTSFAKARDGIVDSLRLMGARGWVISTNVPLRRDGLPYASTRNPDDPGVAVYFEHRGRRNVICCDRWNRVEHNLQALNKTLEAMRGLERWGASEILDRMFQGFNALPEQAGSGVSCWTILGIEPTTDHEKIRSAYRKKARETHPDHGGDHNAFVSVSRALDEALKHAGTGQSK